MAHMRNLSTKPSKNVLASLLSVDTSDLLHMSSHTLLHTFSQPDTFQAEQPVQAGLLHMCIAAHTVAFHSHPAFQTDKVPKECQIAT